MMKIALRAAGIAGLGLAMTAALGITGASASTTNATASTTNASTISTARSSGRSGVVFVQDDDPAGNHVLAYDRARDGHLVLAGTYPTGGLGGQATGSVADNLASQGSLVADDGLLYAVNAGSDTITVLSISGDHLQRRQTISSGGEFPVSITVHNDLVYVLNARDGGSVQGFRLHKGLLGSVPAWHRSLGLDSTQTPEFTHSPGQVAFTPSGHQLVVTTKAGGQSVEVFGVGRSGIAPAVSNPLPGTVPFAVTFGDHDVVAVAEAGTNSVATFRLGDDGVLTPIATAPTGGAATCWIVGAGKYVYASNAGSGALSGFQLGRSGSLASLGDTPTDAGTIDAAVTPDAKFLYVQAGVAGTVDGFSVGKDGTLTPAGSVTVPGGDGGEGIVAL